MVGADSHSRGFDIEIARKIMLVGGLVLLAKLAGAAKEMTLAAQFGLGPVIDAYQFLFNLMQWPIGILAGVVSAVVVPLTISARSNQPDSLRRFNGELLGTVMLVGLLLGGVAAVTMPYLPAVPGLGVSAEQARYIDAMYFGLAWMIPAAVLAQLFGAWTMAANRHLNTLLEAVPALLIILAVLAFSGYEPLVWGTLLGVCLQSFLLLISLLRRGDVPRPSLGYGSPLWKPFLAGFGLMMVGQFFMSFVTVIDQVFAIGLEDGAVSALSYANRLVGLVLGLGAVAVGRAILPIFARVIDTQGRRPAGLAARWGGLLFLAGLLVVSVGLWQAEWLVRVVFQRGEFGADDTRVVADALRYGLLQVPFYLASIVLGYALIAAGDYRAMALIGFSSLVVKLVLNALLVDTMGLQGLLLATAGVYLVSVLISSARILAWRKGS